MEKINIIIDGKEIQADKDETIMNIARDNGIKIPNLCYHPEVNEGGGSCRLCLVEVHENGWMKMVTACNYPVRKGNVEIRTSTPKVNRIRKMILELLMTRVTESDVIRDLAREYGVEESRFEDNPKPGNRKCFSCGLCVQICEDVVGVSAISMLNRGPEKRPGTPFGKPSSVCIGCGACAYACPTDAIKMVDSGDTRKIWNTEFKLVKCKECGRAFMTDAQIDFIVKKTGKDRAFFDKCPDCR